MPRYDIRRHKFGWGDAQNNLADRFEEYYAAAADYHTIGCLSIWPKRAGFVVFIFF